MGVSTSYPTNWKDFEAYARNQLARTWNVDLAPRRVLVGGSVSWKFDLVSQNLRVVGDAKWLKNIRVPAAKWQGIAEYIWLLQKVDADRVFLVFGQDVEVPERYLSRVRPITAPVEFYYLGPSGLRVL